LILESTYGDRNHENRANRLETLKAAIHCLSGYSAHADQQTLCDWVTSIPEPPGEIRLVHGEPEAQKALRSELDNLF
jgi:Cft2 family RNA processing exonuclease